MRKLLLALTLFCLLLPACGVQPAPTATPTPAAMSSVVETPTSLTPDTLTPDTTSTPSATPQPTETPAPPTITSLPTIPTYTPTFDVHTIVTATPAPAMCPKVNPDLNVDFGFAKARACYQSLTVYDDYNQCVDRELQNKILNFLKLGGSIDKVISQLNADGRQKWLLYQDLTHDGIKDLAFRNAESPVAGYYFYICKNGDYVSQSFWDGDNYGYQQRIKSTQDLNANGIPDIVITIGNVLIVLEWNGTLFEQTLRIDDYGAADFGIKDVDGNGLFDITLSRDFPPMWNEIQEFPWRHYISVYAWNGTSYVRISKTFDAPVYRFQVIQDADQYLVTGNYQQAIELYQDAIFNNELGWWSLERRRYELEKKYSALDLNKPTLSPAPVEDLTEYPHLVAYAYYRMVILHTFLGEMDPAKVKYATLQEKFPADSPGYPYVEMATAFWDAYQSTQKMYDGCAAAIGYAAAHPEILTPLGSDYHGAQSHTYVPADVCPFR